ncbi:MAG: efflux RND transporter periplasmic adaptor subunit [Candidatus Pseudobacter hemicellulosilyticus]|uniref:Efflux RND transporter periplasmic adaptor subunit n=1 Tax=Candidatus Pseudobacter hemicellulosilyticus TaxID=3121375 RepID=A0AAJ5WWP8_9BACT|nr:MAG: efflux RND transporter periplasmic adaptor subunit [Pseudobacter sp.]
MNRVVFYLTGYASLLSLLLLSCSPAAGGKEEKKAVLVKVQQLAIDSSLYQQEYVGTVDADNAVDVSFLVGGAIEQLFVSEGQRVSKGQLLGRLNTTSLKHAHELAVAALNQAEDAYKRLSAMYENNSLPEIQYMDIRSKLAQARASEAIARKSLQDCAIYAPQSGVTGKRYLEPGATVMPGTPVYSIMNISHVKVKVAIPEGEISSIRTGDPSVVRISALADRSYDGRVLEKGVSANPVSHTYDIKIRVANPGWGIMPGMVCRIYLGNTHEPAGNRIIVPVKAVQVDHSGKRFVWVRDQQGKAAYKEVTLGRLSGNGVQVTAGLAEGEELIIEGYQHISAGLPVLVQN